MFKFVQTQDCDDSSIEMQIGNDVTWWELSERFFNFLQGAGYSLSRQDFAEYWADQYVPDAQVCYAEDDDEINADLRSDTVSVEDPIQGDLFGFNGINTLDISNTTATFTPVDRSSGARAFDDIVTTLGGSR